MARSTGPSPTGRNRRSRATIPRCLDPAPRRLRPSSPSPCRRCSSAAARPPARPAPSASPTAARQPAARAGRAEPGRPAQDAAAIYDDDRGPGQRDPRASRRRRRSTREVIDEADAREMLTEEHDKDRPRPRSSRRTSGCTRRSACCPRTPTCAS